MHFSKIIKTILKMLCHIVIPNRCKRKVYLKLNSYVTPSECLFLRIAMLILKSETVPKDQAPLSRDSIPFAK